MPASLATTDANFSFEVPQREAALGMGFFATDLPGIGGHLRATAEDFRVTETAKQVAEAEHGGKYTLAKVRATNWETNRLVRELAKRLGISERRIFFAGTKDKRAVTIQSIAIAASEEAVAALRIKDVDILETQRVDRAPKIGELSGNHFTIRIRGFELDADEATARARAIADALERQGGFPNFFGPQRFGSVRPITHVVGRRIVESDLLEAVWTYVAAPSELDSPELAELRAELWASRDPEEALRVLPRKLDFERMMVAHLAEQPDDAAGALDRLPRTLTRMFVGADQSFLFNRALTARAAKGHHPRDALVGDLLFPAKEDGRPDSTELVPVRTENLARCRAATDRADGFTTGGLPGYAYATASGVQGALEAAVLDEEHIDLDGYRVPAMPGLASKGTRRALWCNVDRIEVTGGEDDEGAFVELGFFLPKGAYATCLLREVMKADLPAYA